MKANILDWLSDFVNKHLAFTGKCYRHCDKPTTMKLLTHDSEHVIGAYACPEGVVSHVVYFSLRPDLAWFKNHLSGQVGAENVQSKDVRLASRHGWELGNGAEEEIRLKLGPAGTITQVYWRRYPSTDAEKQLIVTLCQGKESKPGCLNLFMRSSESNERLCQTCRSGN